MLFEKGNTWWKQKETFGRKRRFEAPEDLLAAAEGYFQWVEDNPILEERVFVSQGDVTRVDVRHPRAMLVGTMQRFIGISHGCWTDYTTREEFKDVCEHIKSVIFQQKFEYGCADMLNPNLVARELGLMEKKVFEHSGPDGKAIELTTEVFQVVGVKADAVSDT